MIKKIKKLIYWIKVIWNCPDNYQGLFQLISLKQIEIAEKLYSGSVEDNFNYKGLMESSKKFYQLSNSVTPEDQKLLASATEYVRKCGLKWK